jgi:hypothetical protein
LQIQLLDLFAYAPVIDGKAQPAKLIGYAWPALALFVAMALLLNSCI